MKRKIMFSTVALFAIMHLCMAQQPTEVVNDTLIKIETKIQACDKKSKIFLITIRNNTKHSLIFNFDVRELNNKEWWYSELLSPMYDPRNKGKNFPAVPYEFDSTNKFVLKYKIIKDNSNMGIMRLRFIFRKKSNIDEVLAIKYSKSFSVKNVKALFK